MVAAVLSMFVGLEEVDELSTAAKARKGTTHLDISSNALLLGLRTQYITFDGSLQTDPRFPSNLMNLRLL